MTLLVGVIVQPSTDLPAGRDTGLHAPRRRWALRRVPWALLAVIAAGGVLGACARHALALAWPHPPGRFPWATFVTNVSGCLLIGVLMVLITEVWSAHRLLRPFLGVGVLGGYTTFSTYTVDVQRLVAAGAARTALLYLIGTALAALAAVHLGVILTRRATGTIGRRKERP
jgi:fluoride exporter